MDLILPFVAFWILGGVLVALADYRTWDSRPLAVWVSIQALVIGLMFAPGLLVAPRAHVAAPFPALGVIIASNLRGLGSGFEFGVLPILLTTVVAWPLMWRVGMLRERKG